MKIQLVGKKSIKLDWEAGEYPVLFPDFSGRGDQWTPPGKHSFCLSLTEEQIKPFAELGFTGFKELRKRDPEDPNEEQHYRLKVKVMLTGKYPPDLYYIIGGKKTKLDVETAGIIDRARIVEGEMCITVSEWQYQMSKGVHLILNNATFVVEERTYSGKYDNIPMANEVKETDTEEIFL